MNKITLLLNYTLYKSYAIYKHLKTMKFKDNTSVHSESTNLHQSLPYHTRPLLVDGLHPASCNTLYLV